MTFAQEFVVHPVGQGLFYTGQLALDKTKFHMVYDCGSISAAAGDRTVERFLTNLAATDPIDLLVISHFDEDHVNKIGKLLQGNRQVRNLVLPFMNFEERLFLALRIASDTAPADDDPDFSISLIIDPVGTLGPNLEGDSTIFIINSGPNKPVSSGDAAAERTGDALTFDIPEAKPRADELLTSFKIRQTNVALKQATDDQKGILYSTRLLMEFIFYRKRVGSKDLEFFEEIKTLFFKKYSIDEKWSTNQILTETTKVIKQIKGSTQIKRLFDAAHKKLSKAIKLPKNNLLNMNATSLCMLHLNVDELKLTLASDLHGCCDVYPLTGVEPIGQEINTFTRYWRGKYPNTLLTSDGYFLKELDVDNFLEHYKNYLSSYWLFQIPHHGSENNSNSYLLSQVCGHVFINFGVNHKRIKKFKHPSNKLMQELSSVGLINHYLAVNEFRAIRSRIMYKIK